MLKKTVSIIIPNYNGKHLLEKYLPFTKQAIENEAVLYEIIVVDDCSKDDSILYLTKEYPEIKILKNEVNSGFSVTCNKGIAYAGMELILLLNSDVKLAPDYFSHLWRYFEDSKTFGVMGRIIDMGGTHIQDAARMPKSNGFKFKTKWFYYLEGNEKAMTFYLSGANALINANKLKAIGGFNPIFSPFYCEDFDLGLRAWRLNWECYYEHNSVCEHELSASTKDYKKASWVKMIYFRNRYYLHALHLSKGKLILWFLQITFLDLLPKILTGKFWLAKSYYGFLKNMGNLKESRRNFKQIMKENSSNLTIDEVISLISKSVEGKEVIKVNS